MPNHKDLTPDQIADDEAMASRLHAGETYLRTLAVSAVVAVTVLVSAGCQGPKYQDNLNNQPLTPVTTTAVTR